MPLNIIFLTYYQQILFDLCLSRYLKIFKHSKKQMQHLEVPSQFKNAFKKS